MLAKGPSCFSLARVHGANVLEGQSSTQACSEVRLLLLPSHAKSQPGGPSLSSHVVAITQSCDCLLSPLCPQGVMNSWRCFLFTSARCSRICRMNGERRATQ